MIEAEGSAQVVFDEIDDREHVGRHSVVSACMQTNSQRIRGSVRRTCCAAPGTLP